MVYQFVARSKVDRMRMKWTGWVVWVAILLAACSPQPPLYFGPQHGLFGLSSNVEAINSPGYAMRPPPLGQPDYFETIRYIDDGVKYIDPYAEFFISYDGQMCFRGLVNRNLTKFENYQNYWCMYPVFVKNVEELRDNVTTVNSVRLWCVLEAPQCARRIGLPNFLDESPWIGNSISAQTRPSRDQRSAIEHLIYLMGGNVRNP